MEGNDPGVQLGAVLENLRLTSGNEKDVAENGIECESDLMEEIGVQGRVENPLENEVVLSALFSLLPRNTLKRCRLVSKNFQFNSLPAWKKCVKIRLSKRNIRRFFKMFENENSPDIGEPFASNFHLVKLFPSNRLWEICGDWINVLDLDQVELPSSQKFQRMVYHDCPNMEQLIMFSCTILSNSSVETPESPRFQCGPSQLKSVSLECCKIDGVSWNEFLTHFHTLENITLKSNYKQDRSSIDAIILTEVLNIRETNPSMLKLKCLDISNWFSEGELVTRVLLDTRLQLEIIRTWIERSSPHHHRDFGVDPETFRRIISLHRTKLKDIDLRMWDWTWTPGSMEKLVRLRLVDGESIGFLRFTPNLRSVVMQGRLPVMDEMTLSAMKNVCIKSCKYLELWRIYGGEYGGCQELRTLKEWFPNIQKIHLDYLDNETLATVCEIWPHLEELDVADLQVDDCGLTGLDESDVERINELGATSSWRPITVPRCNITSLKSLRVLKLGAARMEIFGTFGYCGATWGIMQIPSLKRFDGSGVNWEPRELERRLKRRFPFRGGV